MAFIVVLKVQFIKLHWVRSYLLKVISVGYITTKDIKTVQKHDSFTKFLKIFIKVSFYEEISNPRL